jgi:alkanesulfonate monooxygenase SsuD/methylene tetrahydromethanopterin reductase-like flavin-dependent oxidoreductase (luciferase family)
MLGQDFHRRGAVANEYLEAVELLWGHDGDAAAYHGRYVDFEGISGVRPLQRPHPPVWVGGLSEAAMRRTLRLGTAWHPNRLTLSWLRDTGLPAMRRIADEMGRPMPALCPRIPFKLTEQPETGEDRPPGVGTLEQVHDDLKELDALGAEHVILDRYVAGDLAGTRDHEAGLRMLKTAAEQLVDLPNERLR